MIGTLGGNDTISYAMVEGTTTDRLIDTLGGNDSFGSDGADTLRASYFGGNSTSGSAQNNGDIIVSGNGADLINGGYSELHPIFEIITLPPRPAYPRPSFTDTIDGELFSSGASPVEVTLFLPAVQSALETASRLSGFITGGNGRDSI